MAAVKGGTDRASRLRGSNHVAVINPNAASAPISLSASGQSGKHLLDLGITGFDPTADISSLDAWGRVRHRLNGRELPPGMGQKARRQRR
jgi:hypothetical protein